MSYTLGQAAKATGKSKSVIQNAIKKGHISASRDALNQWSIDPAELHRVYPVAVLSTHEKNDLAHSETSKIIELEGRLKALQGLLEEVKHGRDKAEENAAAWQAQAEAIKLLVAPLKADKPSFWRRLVG